MNIKFKELLIIFLVALLGGYIGSFSADQFHTVEEKVEEKGESIPTTTIRHEESDLKEGIQNAYDSVVEIMVSQTSADFFHQETTTNAVGSGVIYSEDGYIITNNHVISGATSVSVQTADGQIYPAELIGTDTKTDLAVIKIDAENLKAVEIANSDGVEVGDTAIVIGNPLGIGLSVSDGIISALNIEVTLNNETMELIQTSAAVNQGNSGGGLFNSKGELIGIVNAKKGNTSISVSVEGLGYAIPSNRVFTIVSDIVENGYVKNRPTLGISVSYVEQDTYNLPKGLYVAEVYEDTAAKKAGLEVYDRIIGFNDTAINTYADLSKALSASSIGEEIVLKVVRNEKILDIKITLQEGQVFNK